MLFAEVELLLVTFVLELLFLVALFVTFVLELLVRETPVTFVLFPLLFVVLLFTEPLLLGLRGLYV